MERQYKIMWKEDFVNFLKESPYYSVAKLAKGEFHVRVWIAIYKNLSVLTTQPSFQKTEGAAQKPKEKPNYCWNLMPPELKPNFKRAAATPKASTVLRPALVKRNRTDKTVDEKLKLLEEKEKQGVTAVGAPKIKTETVDAEDEEMDEGGVEDDEMDDENDYGNSYFDNGESFNDDDDNLDDGPVY